MVPVNLHAQSVLMPEPGMLITQSSSFSPSVLKGVTIHPDQPFHLDFFVDKGESGLNAAEFEAESIRLIKYFMASLAVPEKDLWVNLSPHEQGRIIPDEFGLTEMGRDLLAQDYLLKQYTASLMYPENQWGKEFWDRVYKKSFQKYGTTDIPVDTFNKVWIIPDKAVIYEKDNSAYIVESRLKVMLEQDYKSLVLSKDKDVFGSVKNEPFPDNLTSEIVREVLIPEIEREVNEGKHFARLRQVYHSLILATWYKENMHESMVNQVYSNRNKIDGIVIDDKQSKIKIYNQYLEAFKKGVYNYIREDYDQYKDQIVPRQYFSGGMNIKPKIYKVDSLDSTEINGDWAMISTRLDLTSGGKIIDEKSDMTDQAVLADHSIEVYPDEKFLNGLSIEDRWHKVYFLSNEPYTFTFDRKGQLLAVYYKNDPERSVPWKWIRDDDGRTTGVLISSPIKGELQWFKNKHFGGGKSLEQVSGWVQAELVKGYKDNYSYVVAGSNEWESADDYEPPKFISVAGADRIGETVDVHYINGWPVMVRFSDGELMSITTIRNREGKVVRSVTKFPSDERKKAFVFENVDITGRRLKIPSADGREKLPIGQGPATIVFDHGSIVHIDQFVSAQINVFQQPLTNQYDVITALKLNTTVDRKALLRPFEYIVFREPENFKPVKSFPKEIPRESLAGFNGIITGKRLTRIGNLKFDLREIGMGGRRFADAPVDIVWLSDLNVFLIDVLNDAKRTAVIFDMTTSKMITDGEDLDRIRLGLAKLGLDWYLDPVVKAVRAETYNSLIKRINGLRIFSSRLDDLKRIKDQWYFDYDIQRLEKGNLRFVNEIAALLTQQIGKGDWGAYLRATIHSEKYINLVMRANNSSVGYLLAAPLETFSLDIFKRDMNYGKGNTIYIHNIAAGQLYREEGVRGLLERLTDEIIRNHQGIEYVTVLKEAATLNSKEQVNTVDHVLVRGKEMAYVRYALRDLVEIFSDQAQLVNPNKRIKEAHPVNGIIREALEDGHNSSDSLEFKRHEDKAMVSVDHFIEDRANELKRLTDQTTSATSDQARWLSLQWRSAMMKAWDDGESIIHTDEELGEIGARMNALWKEAGFDRYGSWPAQMMLLNVRQLPEEQYFSFIEKQEALISRTTRQEKLTAYWINGVKYASHLRYYGTHPEGHFQKPFSDNEILIDIAQKYIALLAEEDLDSLPLEYLWGLVVMLDPLVHNPDFRLDNWDEVVPTGDPEMMMHDYIVRIFERVKFQGVDQERLKELLTKAFGMSDQQWTAAGFRSPYVEFAGFNFNLPLGDIFSEFSLKGDSSYTLDQVFLLARPQQFFLDNFRFAFNTRDPDRIKEFLFSNKRYQEPQNGIRQIFTNMSKALVLEAVKKDPRYFYKQVFGSRFFQAATGFDHLGDILGGQKDAAVLGKKPTDEAVDRFITSSQIGEFFDFIDSINLPQGAIIKMIGSAETPQLGMAFALNGYDVRSITLDLKGTTIEATYQELLTDNIKAAGGQYRVYADTNYLDLPEEEQAPVMIAALNVLDDPKTTSQDKMIEKMFNEVSEGGYLIFDFVINKEYWYGRIESYADQNGYLLEPLHRMPIKGTVYKVTHKPALVDAAMTAEVARMYRFLTGVDLPAETDEVNRQSDADQAVMGKDVGGIDFTGSQLDLEIHRDQNGLPIPLTEQQLQNIQINGLVPVILKIQPVTQLPFLLGAVKADPAENSSKTTPSISRDEAVIKESEYVLSVL